MSVPIQLNFFMMLKVTVVCLLFLNGFVVRFEGTVKCAITTTKAVLTPPRGLSKRKPPKRHYDPNFGYEPYWPGGEWVLYGDPNATSTTPAPEVCGDECSYIYNQVGKICGREIGNLKYRGCVSNMFKWCKGDQQTDLSGGYQTFDTYCEFLDKACKSAGDSQPPFLRWIYVHRGPCIKNHNITYKPMYRPENVVSRLHFYMKSVNETFAKLGRTPY